MQNHFIVNADDIKEVLGVPVLGVIPDLNLA